MSRHDCNRDFTATAPGYRRSHYVRSSRFFLSFLLLLAGLSIIASSAIAQSPKNPLSGTETRRNINPSEESILAFPPYLTINGDTISPIVGDSADLVLTMCVGPQKWTLLKEYTLWANNNRFGYYTDLGVGNNQTILFRGPDGFGTQKTTSFATGSPIGLWLLNDTAGDTTYTIGDSYLFSERALTLGSGAQEHQWFKVYNVSAYKGTGATYILNTFTFNDTTTGSFDYLIYIDDDHSSANFDHNDMIVGVTCISSPPQVTCPEPADILACGQSSVCIPGFEISDPDNNIASVVVNGGTLSGDTVCFTPSGAGPHLVQVIVTDSTGMADTCQTEFNITMNSPPICDIPADTSIYQCYPIEICLPLFSWDPDGNFAGCEIVSGPGAITGKVIDKPTRDVPGSAATPVPEWCYLPTQDTAFDVVIRCMDTCGEFCEDTFHVVIELDDAPVCHTPGDTTITLCSLDPICLPVYCTDDENNQIPSSPMLLTPKGVLSNGQWCYTPTGNEVVPVTIRCEDSCGLFCEKTFTITFVTALNPPVCSGPNDTTIYLCSSTQVCLPVGCTDPDGDLLPHQPSLQSGPGVITNGTWCYTPTQSGAVTVTTRCTDKCGRYCEKTFTVTFWVNSAPQCVVPHDTTIFQCTPAQICLPVSCTDIDNNLKASQPTLVSNKGSIANGYWCYTPGTENEDLTVTVKCEDTCGASSQCNFVVHIRINRAPMCTVPNFDSTYFLCAPTQICRPTGCTDPDGNMLPGQPTIKSGPGSIVGGQWCYTPTLADTAVHVVLECKDSCGAICEQTMRVAFRFNQPPVCSGPSDTTIKLCSLQEICLPVGCSDPDGNLLAGQPTLVSSPGTIKNGNWCYTPTGYNESLTITTKCEDACGVVCTRTFHVNAHTNQAPIYPGCPPVLMANQCNPTPVCFNFGAIDPDGDKVVFSVISGKGTIDQNGLWCYTPTVSETFTLVIGFRDTVCTGQTTQCQTDIIIKVNRPPVAVGPHDTTIVSCKPFTICLPGFSYSDPDNNLMSVVAEGGTLSNSAICFTPVLGTNTLKLIVTDSCGKADTAITNVFITDSSCLPTCPDVRIAKIHNAIQGMNTCVPITISNHSFVSGGFDLLVSYDNSALTLGAVTPGQMIGDCRWEYFTYRFGPFGNCGTACPSGLVRIIAIAETNNGANHPLCFGPTDNGTYELAELCFLVSNDRTLECQFVPVRFFWIDCGDNTFSNKAGDTSFVNDEIFDYDNPSSIADPLSEYPTYYGVQYNCLIGGGTPDKPAPMRCIDFYNGGVDIVCADSIDARGDINLNGLSYEVADAVMFSNYFIVGLSAFGGHVQGSIAASDVNADGISLTVADLVYLIRVVVGDATAYPKLSPVEMKVIRDGDAVAVDGTVGAAYLTFRGDVVPHLLADGMEMKYAFDGSVTRVLIFSMNRGGAFSGAFVEARATLVSIEMATYEGTPVAAKFIPLDYQLSQNYPNPFNPATNIEFALPSAGDYVLHIYNVSGQEVATFNGHAEAGLTRVQWNAADMASGIYLYRLDAGEFSQTRKMVLIK